MVNVHLGPTRQYGPHGQLGTGQHPCGPFHRLSVMVYASSDWLHQFGLCSQAKVGQWKHVLKEQQHAKLKKNKDRSFRLIS